MPGKVILVGAGPGDPGLLTVAGAKAIASADVVVYDRLVNPVLVRGKRAIYVGKRSGGDSVKQPQINRLIVRLAKSGKRVVRLKGGDPIVFARGAEEIEFLRKHGVPYEIIPGVTSGIAAPTYAGIPLTHRDLASKVVFATARGRRGPIDLSNVPADATLVLYMGAGQPRALPQFPPETPVAVIEWGTWPQQKVTRTTLGALKHANPPSIIVVGKVAALNLGKRVVLLRPEGEEDEISRGLQSLGVDVVRRPLHRIKVVRRVGVKGHDWVAFTSANAVRAFRNGGPAKIAAVGPGTAAAVEKQLHVKPDLVPATHTTKALAEALAALKPRRVLHPASAKASPELRNRLAGRIDEIVVYKPEPIRSKPLPEADAVVFTSAEIVRAFVKRYRARPVAVSIGPKTSAALRAAKIRVAAEANPHSAAGVVEAVRKVLRG